MDSAFPFKTFKRKIIRVMVIGEKYLGPNTKWASGTKIKSMQEKKVKSQNGNENNGASWGG